LRRTICRDGKNNAECGKAAKKNFITHDGPLFDLFESERLS